MYSTTQASNMKTYFVRGDPPLLRAQPQRAGPAFIPLMQACKREQACSTVPQH